MTAPSSSKKSFFRKYFLFRLNAQKGSLALSTIFGMAVFPGAALELNDIIKSIYNDEARLIDAFYDIRHFFFIICLAGMLIMPVIGAAFSFMSCNRRKYTDMIGGLPLTHKERFWGDFLSGCTAYVAPMIPAGIIAVIISFSVQSMIDKLDIKYGFEPSFTCVRFAFGMVVSAFALLSLMYIISTVAVVCCGRPAPAGILSIISLITPCLVVLGISGCFVNSITGLPSGWWEIQKTFRWFPPLGLLWDINGNYNYLRNIDIGDPPHYANFFSTDFAVLNPLYMLYVIIFAAALTALAYYLSKSRRQEQVGSVIIHKAYFRVISVMAAGGAAMIALAFAPIMGLGLSALTAAFASAIILLLLEIVRKPSAREVVKTLICWVGTAVCCAGIYLLFDKTGAFGLRYINVSSDKVESAHIGINYMKNPDKYQIGEYEITDKAEIEKLINDYNDTCKEIYGDLIIGGQLWIDLTLTDGTTVSRYVSEKERGAGVHRLIDNVCRLDSFPEMQSALLTDNTYYGCEAKLDGIFGTITVPEEKLDEFLELFAEELREKYYHAASEVGEIVLVLGEGQRASSYFPIAENYTKTVNYLRSLYENTDYYDDDTLIMRLVSLDPDGRFSITLNIYRRDVGSEPVKELISLLKLRQDVTLSDRSVLVRVEFPDSSSDYYVPIEAEQRVSELILELAEKSVDTGF